VVEDSIEELTKKTYNTEEDVREEFVTPLVNYQPVNYQPLKGLAFTTS